VLPPTLLQKDWYADRWAKELELWRQGQVDECEKAGDWFAALFHLKRLQDQETKLEAVAAVRERRTRILMAAIQRDPKDGLAWVTYLRSCPQWQQMFGLWPLP
jgi:hypothetical protein